MNLEERETVKLLLNHLIDANLLDCKETRESLKARETMFEKNGYGDAAGMLAILRMGVEPKRKDTRAPNPAKRAERVVLDA